MQNLFAALNAIDLSQDCVLAIVTKTEGSTYRKAGTLMLLDHQLNYFGLISGGCLEGDIQQHAQDVLNNQRDHQLYYNMRGEEDSLWGMGLGCDGAIEILLKYLPASKRHLEFFDYLARAKQGEPFYLQLSLQTPHAIEYFRGASRAFSPLEPETSTHSQTAPKAIINAEKINSKTWRQTSSCQLIIQINSPLSLLICGASPDVPPVTAIAKQIGWHTTVIDHRKSFIIEQNFPEATLLKLVKRSQWSNFDLSPFDIVVLMSHQFEQDKSYLNKLLSSHIQYIGLLGPSQRRDQLLAALDTSIENHQGRIFGPVGLDIGADTPETIALAIIAEIQAVIAGKNLRNSC